MVGLARRSRANWFGLVQAAGVRVTLWSRVELADEVASVGFGVVAAGEVVAAQVVVVGVVGQ